MTKDNTTPRPWFITLNNIEFPNLYDITDHKGCIIARKVSPQDALLIVKSTTLYDNWIEGTTHE